MNFEARIRQDSREVGVVCWLRQTVWIQLTVVVVSLLLLARPLQAATGTTPLDRVVQTDPAGPVGYMAVWQTAQQCPHLGYDVCLKKFRKWVHLRGLHPLTRTLLDLQLAHLTRLKGEREQATLLAESAGFIRVWELPLPGGDVLTLNADPITGAVSSNERVELMPGGSYTVRAALTAEHSIELSLRLDAMHVRAICCNGKCQAQKPLDHSFPDAIVVGLTLQKGRNLLELTFAEEATNLQLVARLTTPSGVPVGVRPDSSKEFSRVSASRGAGRNPEAVGSLSDWLEQQDDSGPVLLARLCLEDAFGESGTELADEILVRFGELSNEERIWALKCMKGRDILLEALHQARTWAPEDPRIELLYISYLLRTGQSWEAWMEYEQFSNRTIAWQRYAPDFRVRAVLLERRVLAALGLPEVAQSSLRQALQTIGETIPSLVTALTETYLENERFEAADKLLERFLNEWPGERNLATSRLFLLERLGLLEEARKLAERLSWLYPTSVYQLYTLAHLFERLGETKRAEELFSVIAMWGQQHPYFLDGAAQFHFRNGNREKAVELWLHLYELRPHNREIRALLQKLDAAPEDDSGLQLSHQDLRRLAQELPADNSNRLVGLADHTRVKLYANGATSTIRTQAVFVSLPVSSARPFSIRFVYDSYLEEATILQAERLLPDGSAQPAEDYGDFALSDEAFNLFYDLREMVVRFEHPEVGEILVITYEIQATPSALGIPFSGIAWLQEGFPKRNNSVTIHMPAGKELFHRIGPANIRKFSETSVDSTDRETVYRFDFPTLPPASYEPFPPGAFERLGFLHYSSMADWEEFGQWYAGLLSRSAGADEALREKVRELAEDADSTDEIIRRFSRFVSDEIRYVGLELGVHGLRPYPPVEVLQRGFGDCKDKSLLLVTMLAEVDIPAQVVTLMTVPRGVVDLSPGSPSLFDHAIVYLDGPDLYFDPTARYVGLDVLPWQDQGTVGLRFGQKGPQAVELPVSIASDNLFSIHLEVTDPKILKVEGTLTFTGQFSRHILLARENRGAWENVVEGYVSSALPVIALDKIEEDIRDEEGTVVLTVSGLWKPGLEPDVKLLPDPGSNVAVVRLPERKMPMVFAHPYTQRFELVFTPAVAGIPDGLAASMTNEDAEFHVSMETRTDQIEVRVHFEQKNRQVPVQRYQDYRELILKYQEALSRLQVTREGAP